jgi:accessory gene regulator protein AgrB
MTAHTSRTKGIALLWWTAYALFLAYVLLPGPDRTPFSGLPMATKTQALFFPLVVLGVFCLFFRPRNRVRPVWLIVLGLAVALKLILAPMVVETGWKGRYWWVKTWTDAENNLTLQRFYQHQEKRWYRVDRQLSFNRDTFNLPFVNNHHPAVYSHARLPRDIQYPLRVEWTGWVADGGSREVTVTAAGFVTIEAGRERVFSGRDPQNARVVLPLTATGPQSIRVTYVKPPEIEPAFTMAGLQDVVLPSSDLFDGLDSSRPAKGAIVFLGVLAGLALLLAFANAYGPISRLVLEELWDRQSKVWAIALLALFLILGLGRNVLHRQITHTLALGDDFLSYESMARQIFYNGLLMVDDTGQGKAYFHYPLYPYAVAAAHGLFGEDWGSVLMFNAICVAAMFPLFWRMLRNRIAEGALIAVLVLFAVLFWKYWMPYTMTAYSDNLYLPVVFGTLAVFIRAMERPSTWRFAAVGFLTALGAATRPSFLIFVPFALLAIVLQKRIGAFATRVKACIAYVFGFGVGVAPFTLRNWLVTGKFVLLVSSFMMLPMFVYAPEEQLPASAQVDAQGQHLTASGSIRRFAEIVAERPLKVAWLEVRKIGFNFGLTFLGPKDGEFPVIFFVFPIAFLFAVRTKRIPWSVQTVILAFAASHIAAIVIATPWTYGYKTIVPMHLAFILGIAFLLPKWGTVKVLELPELPHTEPMLKPRVSVVLPTYNEKDSIRRVIQDFMNTGVADEVIVINNNAAPGTSEEVAGTGAIEIFEKEQGYGAACQRGLREATGDYIVLCEPDGTFEANDIHKLLAYAPDFDVVFGSRTSQQFVWRGANMGFFLRFGNWAVAKYMELLFNGPNLTDVGCTMRLVKRHVAQELAGQYRIKGSHFGPEMMALTLRQHHYRAVQIPVNYKPRVGVSSVTGDPGTAFWLGVQMIWLITRHAIAASAEGTPFAGPEHASS